MGYTRYNIMRYTGQAVMCLVTAIASSAGTTIWHSYLKPKMLDKIDEEEAKHKNPIGFRMD